MANGEWHGSEEEQRRVEAPLLVADPVIEAFASEHGLRITRNYKNWPGRWIQWGKEVRCSMNIYLSDEKGPSWNVSLSASQYRRRGFLWWRRWECFGKGEMLLECGPLPVGNGDLAALLREGKQTLDAWSGDPEVLEFSGKTET